MGSLGHPLEEVGSEREEYSSGGAQLWLGCSLRQKRQVSLVLCMS